MSKWEQHDDFLARWLNDELSPEERAEFENSAEGKEYMQLIGAADKIQAPAYDVEGELSKLNCRIKSHASEAKPVSRGRFIRLAVAASVAIIAVASYFLLQPNLTKFRTAPGQQEIVKLPDGSEVRLNGNSTLAYNPDKWQEERRLTLEGEGFFEVIKGSSFVVDTDLGSVTVLGTSFNVRTRNKKLEVVCYTGKVNVSSTNANKDLLPGDAVRVEKGSITRSWTGIEETQPSWLDGLTILDEVPLEEALEELKNVFGMSVSDYDLPDTLKIRGFFDNSNPNEALDIVLGTLRINYQYDSLNNSLRILGMDR